MLDSFVPESAIERAFVQSLSWDSKRLWSRSLFHLERSQWPLASAFMLQLACSYARDQHVDLERSTVFCILDQLPDLTTEDKRSICKCARLAIEILIEELDLMRVDPRIDLIVRLMLAVAASFEKDILSKAYVIHLINQALFDNKSPYNLDNFADYYELIRRRTEEEASRTAAKDLPDPKKAWMSEPVPDPKLAWANPQKRPPLEPATTSQPQPVTYRTAQDKLLGLEDALSKARTNHGLYSRQTVRALAEIIEFALTASISVPFHDHLNQLATVCSQLTIPLDSYELRQLYSISSQISDRPEMQEQVQRLLMLLVERRESLVGYDIETAMALNGLLGVWQSTGTLAEGKAYCEALVKRASAHLHESSLALRHIKSALAYICYLLMGEKSATTTVRSGKYDDVEQYLVSMILHLLDKLNSKEKAEPELVLNELVAYYADCIDFKSFRIGEMLWLLMETEALQSKTFSDSLARASEIKAKDAFLTDRLTMHMDLRSALHKEFNARPQLIHKINKKVSELYDAMASATAADAEIDDEAFALASALRGAGEPKRAISLLETRFESKFTQLTERGRYYIRLAQAHIAAGQVFEAAETIFAAWDGTNLIRSSQTSGSSLRPSGKGTAKVQTSVGPHPEKTLRWSPFNAPLRRTDLEGSSLPGSSAHNLLSWPIPNLSFVEVQFPVDPVLRTLPSAELRDAKNIPVHPMQEVLKRLYDWQANTAFLILHKKSKTQYYTGVSLPEEKASHSQSLLEELLFAVYHRLKPKISGAIAAEQISELMAPFSENVGLVTGIPIPKQIEGKTPIAQMEIEMRGQDCGMLVLATPVPPNLIVEDEVESADRLREAEHDFETKNIAAAKQFIDLESDYLRHLRLGASIGMWQVIVYFFASSATAYNELNLFLQTDFIPESSPVPLRTHSIAGLKDPLLNLALIRNQCETANIHPLLNYQFMMPMNSRSLSAFIHL